MKNKLRKKLYLLLSVVFLGISLKFVGFKNTIIKPKNTYEKYDFQENVITQIVDSDSLELYKDSTISDEQKYEHPIYESFLQQQINTEEKEAIRLFRNPKFVFAVLVNNKHQIMIQIQKEYLNGNISSGLIESLLVTNPFKLLQDEIEELRKLIGTPANSMGSISLL